MEKNKLFVFLYIFFVFIFATHNMNQAEPFKMCNNGNEEMRERRNRSIISQRQYRKHPAE